LPGGIKTMSKVASFLEKANNQHGYLLKKMHRAFRPGMHFKGVITLKKL
jgi:hypothetical protein